MTGDTFLRPGTLFVRFVSDHSLFYAQLTIFDKTEETPGVPMILEAFTEKKHLLGHLSGLCDQDESE